MIFLFQKYDTLTKIYKRLLENCIAVKAITFDMDPPDTLLYFNEEVIKTQSQAFRFLQFYKLM